VDIRHFARMLDWAPVLFRSRGDFPGVINHTDAITAVNTIEFFYAIELGELMAVDNNKIRTLHTGYAV